MKTIVYILGDGVQYRFLRDLVGLQLRVYSTDTLRQNTYIVRSSESGAGLEKNEYCSGQVPLSMKLYFLSDLQTQVWLKQNIVDLPQPDMVHVLLETPLKKENWIANLRQMKQRAAAPADVVLCDTGRQGLQTDNSRWEDDFRAGQESVSQIGITSCRYELQTVPTWLCCAVPIEIDLYRQRLRNLIEQMKKHASEDSFLDYTFEAIQNHIEVTPDELKANCYQRFAPDIVGRKLGETIWRRAKISFLSENSEIWKHIWRYYRTKMLPDMLLWEEELEKKELLVSIRQAFDRNMPTNQQNVMARNPEDYQKLIRSPEAKSGDILACEQAVNQFFIEAEHNTVYEVMRQQLRSKIVKMEKILNG